MNHKISTKLYSGASIGVYASTLFFLVCAFFAPCMAHAQERRITSADSIPETQHILLLSSYNISFAQYHQIVSKYLESLSRSGESYTVTQFEVESNAGDRTIEGYARQIAHFSPAIKRGKYKVIIGFGSPVEMAVNGIMDAIPDSTSIIYCKETPFQESEFERHPNTTGVVHVNDVGENIELIRRMFPEKKEILLLTNWTDAGKKVRKDAFEYINRYPDLNLKYIDNERVSTDAMLAETHRVGKNAVILFHGWYNHKIVNFASLRYIMDDFESQYDHPIFVMHAAMLRFNALGGYVEGGKNLGAKLADITIDILRGKEARAIPPIHITPQLFLKWDMLKKYAIEDDQFPKDAIILNAPTGFWATYYEWISGGVISGIILTFLYICGSFVYIILHRRKTRLNLEILNELPVRIGVIDDKENLLFFSANDGVGTDGKQLKKLSDIPNLDYDKISAKIRHVFDTGAPETFDYEKGETKRSMRVGKLPFDTFKCHAVIWISHDNHELQNIRSEAAALTLEKARFIRELTDANNLRNTVINTMPCYFFAKDADDHFRYILANDAFCAFIGRKQEDVIGHTDDELFVDAKNVDNFLRDDLETMSILGSNEFVEKVYNFENSLRILRTIKLGFTEQTGRRILIGISIDITRESNLFESEQVINHVLEQAVIESNFTLIAESVTNTIREIIQSDRIIIAQYNPETKTYSHVTDYNPLQKHLGERKRPEFYTRLNESFTKDELIVASDISNSSFADIFDHSGVRSFIAAPIRIGRDLWGAIFISFSNRRRDFTETDKRIMYSMANIITLAQIRKGQLDQIEHVNALNQMILNNVKVPIALFDTAKRLLCVNTAYCDTVGIPEKTLLSATTPESFVIRANPDYVSLIDVVQEEHAAVKKQVCFKGRDFIVYGDPIFDAKGNIINIVKSAIDVTEQNLLTNNERLLKSCFEMLIPDESIEDAISKVLHKIREHFNADDCNILNFDFIRKEIVCNYEVTANDVPSFVLTDAPVIILPNQPWLDALLQHETFSLHNTASSQARDNLGMWNRIIKENGVRSVYAQGAFSQNKMWGCLCVLFKNETVLSASQVDLLHSLTHIIEMVIERQLNHEKLTYAENENNILLNAVPIPILLYNETGGLLRCNNAAYQLSDHSVEEILAHPYQCNSFFCGRECRPDDCPVLATVKDYQKHSMRISRGPAELMVTSYPVISEGRLTHILKTIIDLTEINQARRQLEIALQKAQRAESVKSTFLATMSHELRTPLNAIIGFSEILALADTTETERVDYLKSINLSGKALLSLINDILDISKIEANQMKIVPAPTDLNALMKELEAIFTLDVHKKGLYLKFDIVPNFPVLMLDELRIRQILINLIGNAVKYTSQGGITVSAERIISTLEISVKDTGIGIDPQYHDLVFKPFEQQDAIRDTKIFKGTGLGLAIAQKLANRMGGKIELASELNQGSTFTVQIPDVPVAQHAIAPSLESTLILQKQLKILLVDDVPMNLKVLCAMLKKMGVESQICDSGANALAILEKEHFDFVLTDMWMPEMNGAQLAQKIHEDQKFSTVKVCVISADSEITHKEESKAFDGFLLKPVSMEQLQKLIAS